MKLGEGDGGSFYSTNRCVPLIGRGRAAEREISQLRAAGHTLVTCLSVPRADVSPLHPSIAPAVSWTSPRPPLSLSLTCPAHYRCPFISSCWAPLLLLSSNHKAMLQQSRRWLTRPGSSREHPRPSQPSRSMSAPHPSNSPTFTTHMKRTVGTTGLQVPAFHRTPKLQHDDFLLCCNSIQCEK